MEYLVVVHRDRPDGPCGVTVPDLPGCFSAGDTLAEALANVREAIALYAEDVLESAEPVAEPSTEIDPDGGIVAAVPLDDGLLSE
ncbi:MAG: type II toxin-antitoxin system HicB family antitoxin [Acidobacteria bacterium]|nr:type II toxin-antitoxin system HicB family antitoxin [Acidobacteriota bacterium]